MIAYSIYSQLPTTSGGRPLHPQPEDAPCRMTRHPSTLIILTIILQTHYGALKMEWESIMHTGSIPEKIEVSWTGSQVPGDVECGVGLMLLLPDYRQLLPFPRLRSRSSQGHKPQTLTVEPSWMRGTLPTLGQLYLLHVPEAEYCQVKVNSNMKPVSGRTKIWNVKVKLSLCLTKYCAMKVYRVLE